MAYTVHTNGICTGTTRGRPPPARGRVAYGTGSKPMLAHIALSSAGISLCSNMYLCALGIFEMFFFTESLPRRYGNLILIGSRFFMRK